MADFEAWLVFLILVVNVVGELQRKRTLAASRGFLAAARLSCFNYSLLLQAAAYAVNFPAFSWVGLPVENCFAFEFPLYVFTSPKIGVTRLPLGENRRIVGLLLLTFITTT